MGTHNYGRTAAIVFWLLPIGSIVFLCSEMFFDRTLVPKWLAFAFVVIAILLYNSVRQIIGKDRTLRVFCDMQDMLAVISVVVSAQSVYGLFVHYGFLGSGAGMPLSGSYDNPAGFASTLSFSLPFVMLGAMSRDRHHRTLHLSAFAVSSVALLLSGSRAGIAAAGIVFILGAHRFMIKRSFVRWFLVVLWVLIFILLLYEKSDSASGRLLIWTCTLAMLKGHWLFGYGPGGFEAGYMNFQAAYFERNPDSAYSVLADNVQYPFSEYLHILVDYGVVGLAAVAVLFGYMAYRYFKNRTPERLAALLAIVSVSTFSLFSYPLMYPFTWFVLIYSFSVLLSDIRFGGLRNRWVRVLPALMTVLICGYVSIRLCAWTSAEIRWKSAFSQGEYDESVLSEYDSIYATLSEDRYFMYNYAYMAYMAGDSHKAADLAAECGRLWADYDLELLRGMISEKLSQPETAVSHYTRAMYMCPNRFRPLYCLMVLYDREGNTAQAKLYAGSIIDKDVKIPSPEVSQMKKLAEEYMSSHSESID